jgi:hypothetical protein
MSRDSIMQDIPAQMCWEYLNGGLRRSTKQEIRDIVIIAIPNKRLVTQMIKDIAYRVGYAKSAFASRMSEKTYKIKKQWIRDTIRTIDKERK